MKKYIKNNIIKSASKIVVVKDGLQYINPSEELIIADGWVEVAHIEPSKPTEEQLLKLAQQKKIDQVHMYDLSDNVNQFSYAGIPMWLDKSTRAGLLLRFQAEKAQGLVSTTLWYNHQSYTLYLEHAINMLYAIEVYASVCYDNTQKHIANISKLTSIEQIEAYDITTGYPQKLSFAI